MCGWAWRPTASTAPYGGRAARAGPGTRARELDVLLETGGDKTAFLPALRRWLGRTRAAVRARFEADNDAEAAVRDPAA